MPRNLQFHNSGVGVRWLRDGLVVLSLLAACAFVSVEAQTAPTAGEDGVILTVEGRVEVLRVNTTAWTPATTNQNLKVRDQLRTGFRSRATLRLSDQSILRVDQLTTLQIQPPKQAANKAVLDLKSGSTFMLNRERPAAVEFRTPQASGAILGTEFHLAVRDTGKTVLTLIDGRVRLGNEVAELSLVSGEEATIETGQPPRKTAAVDTINIIQWTLYYPGVLDPAELGLPPADVQALADSLGAYRNGDLLQALAGYPDARQPGSDAERAYRAALWLAVGRVAEAEAGLQALGAPSPNADALRLVIAAVKLQPASPDPAPPTAGGWLAKSYYEQSRQELEAALASARAAVAKSPDFGFGWARVAELEFGFGRTPAAARALERALELTPRNAQALALKGFLLAARNHSDEARAWFDRAIAVDGALGNAWLGRGLCRIRQGDAIGGRQDLQTAAALEPQRSLLRSYLGKAWDNAHENLLAARELDRARSLDSNDPTPWLYSALLHQRENRVNRAADELEQSLALNDNRAVFRSRLLLDQDRAVRGANLASVYRDVGLTEFSVREATRAVDADFANASAHLFLANSYDAVRDPKRINLRYETPWLSELLLANLLAPVGAGNLSQTVSQQEYSRLLERDRLGVSSITEYSSNGDWWERGSVFGTFGNSSFAIDADYRSENGQRPNNDLEAITLWAKFKQQLTPQDSLFLQAQYLDADGGDLAQYYDQATASRSLRVTETQQPNLFAGYHREWSPGSHTLLLFGRLDDTLTQTDLRSGPNTGATVLTLNHRATGELFSVSPRRFDLNYERDLESYAAEVQQIYQKSGHNFVGGARFQGGSVDPVAQLARTTGDFPPIYGAPGPASDQDLSLDLQRASVYGYYYWQILRSLQLTAGVSYDWLKYPENSEVPPLSPGEKEKDQVSPKAGLLWTPCEGTAIRGAYTQSLGGVFYDNSVRLEPVQIAGFNQAFRSLIPESVAGIVPGTRFETAGVAVDQKFKSNTYLTLAAEQLKSRGDRTVGVFDFTVGTLLAVPSGTPEELDYVEKTVTATVNQLIGENLVVGASYRLTDANLQDEFTGIPQTVSAAAVRDVSATLHQVRLYARVNVECGFFAQFDTVWSQQSNRGYTPDIPGDDFWQFNVFAGYRFLGRAAEWRVGVLNLTDRDYQLNPLTLYTELPRERTFVASLRLQF